MCLADYGVNNMESQPLERRVSEKRSGGKLKDEASQLTKVFQKVWTAYENVDDAGQLFLVDGDSLLLDALGSPCLHRSPGAQLLQALFHVEQRLERLAQAGRRYWVVFFDAMRALWRRPSHVLVREAVIRHLRAAPRTMVKQFPNWECEAFSRALATANPSFFVASASGGPLSQRLSPAADRLLRRLTAHLLSRAVRVVRVTDLAAEDTRLTGYHTLTRESTAADYAALLPLPPLPTPAYGGLLAAATIPSSASAAARARGELAPRDAGEEAALLGLEALLGLWASRNGGGSDDRKGGISLSYDGLASAEKTAQEALAQLGSQEEKMRRVPVIDSESETEDDVEAAERAGGDDDGNDAQGEPAEPTQSDALETQSQSSDQGEDQDDESDEGGGWDAAEAGNSDDGIGENWDAEDDENDGDEGDGGAWDADGDDGDEDSDAWNANTPDATSPTQDSDQVNSAAARERRIKEKSEALRKARETRELLHKWTSAAGRMVTAAARAEYTDMALMKIALIHLAVSSQYPLSAQATVGPRLPPPRPTPPTALARAKKTPVAFLELYAAHLARGAMNSPTEAKAGATPSQDSATSVDPLFLTLDSRVFVKIAAVAWLVGDECDAAALGLPNRAEALLKRLWSAFLTCAGLDGGDTPLFPISLGDADPSLRESIAEVKDLQAVVPPSRDTKSAPRPVLNPIQSKLISTILTDADRKALEPYTAPTLPEAEAVTAEPLVWNVPDPLADEREDPIADSKRGRSQKEREVQEAEALRRNQLYLNFMTKYAQSLSGTKLVLRDVIVAKSSSSSDKKGGKAKWQGSRGGKQKGWNPGGKRGKKKNKGGAKGFAGKGQAAREQIKAQVDAKKRQDVKESIAAYVNAAMRINIRPKISAEERKRKEEAEMGLTFTRDEDRLEQDERGDEKAPPDAAARRSPTVALPALEQRIESLDERLLSISDPHVIPALLVLLDWCVLAWCEQRAQDGVAAKPTDKDMRRAVRVFQFAHDVRRRFGAHITLAQLGRVLFALAVLGFEEQVERILADYCEKHRLKLKRTKAPSRFASGGDEKSASRWGGYAERIAALMGDLGVSVRVPRDDEDEDDDESSSDGSDAGGRQRLGRQERLKLEAKKRRLKAEARRRWSQLANDANKIRDTAERFQLAFSGPVMVRDVRSAPDPRVSGFYPDAWQRQLLDVVDARASALVVAPTSSGKTFASYYAMKKVLTYNRQQGAGTAGGAARGAPAIVVYVCPTKALVSQVSAGVYQRYGSVFGVKTRGHSYKAKDCQVLVTLPEGLEEVLLSPEREAWVSRVKYVIYDEVHSLGGANGALWERLLAAFPAPFLALSATVGNPTTFHKWLQAARARTATVGPAGGGGGGSAGGDKRARRGNRRGQGAGNAADGTEANPFPNDNKEVHLIVHDKRWADLEKAVYLPTASRAALMKRYASGIHPLSAADIRELRLARKRVPKPLLRSGLMAFHPCAAIAFRCEGGSASGGAGGGGGDADGGGGPVDVPASVEFSPRDSLRLYDTMSAAVKTTTARSKSAARAPAAYLKGLAPPEHFAGAPYIGRDAAREYGDRVRAAFTACGRQDGGTQASILAKLSSPLRKGLRDVKSRGESPTSKRFVGRYLLPLLVDLAREDRLPVVAFCLDPNRCEALAGRLLLTLERLEEKAAACDGGAAERRRLARVARRANKLKKRLRDKAPNGGAGQSSGNVKMSFKDVMQAQRARERHHAMVDAIELAAAQGDQDELDQLMNVDKRFSFVDPIDRLDREDLDFWIKRLKAKTGWRFDHPLLRALWRGVGVHHEGLPRSYKDLVETMFRARSLRVVIATGTLAVGVNMPCRTTVFLGDSPLLTPLAFRQMSGRAGRRGYDDVGHVVFLGIPMAKIASLMASPLTSLRGRFPVTPSLALRMAIFHARASDPTRATRMLSNLLTPPLAQPGGAALARQIRFSYRFAVELLARLRAVDPATGAPMGLAGVMARVHAPGTHDPANLALGGMIRSGLLARVCGGARRIAKDLDACARRLMFVLCHLFLRVPLPEGVKRSSFRRSSSMGLLGPLPSYVAKYLAKFDAEALTVFSGCLEAFAATRSSEGGGAGQAASAKSAGSKPATPAPKKRNISKKERKRLLALARLRKGSASTNAAAKPEAEAKAPPLPAQGALPMTRTLVQDPSVDAAEASARSMFAPAPLGHSFESRRDLIDSVRVGLGVQGGMVPVVGGGPGVPSDTLAEGAYAAPLLNAYALDFLKHGQLATIVKDNRLAAARAWGLLRDWDILLSALACAVAEMKGSPPYATVFLALARKFRQRFRALSVQS